MIQIIAKYFKEKRLLRLIKMHQLEYDSWVKTSAESRDIQDKRICHDEALKYKYEIRRLQKVIEEL